MTWTITELNNIKWKDTATGHTIVVTNQSAWTASTMQIERYEHEYLPTNWTFV